MMITRPSGHADHHHGSMIGDSDWQVASSRFAQGPYGFQSDEEANRFVEETSRALF